MKKYFLFVALLMNALLLTAQDNGDVKVYADQKLTTITYEMSHPLHDWSGVSKDVKSVIVTDDKKETIKRVAVTVKIASFDSQNANRDSHCIEVTEALKFPNINFVSSNIEQNGDNLKVTGDLTFHGYKKKITFDATKKKIGNNKIQVNGGFSINMKDFKVDPPSLMGISSDEMIKLSFEAVY